MSKRRIAVIGAGPVGSILAAHLSNAEHEVHLVEVQAHLMEAIKEKGLQIVGVEELYARVDEVYQEIEQLKGIPLDQVYICSKAIDLPAVSRSLEDLGLTHTDYISYQNGIDNEQVLAKHFPKERVFRTVVNYAGMITRPGVVRMTFFHPPNHIGQIVPEGVERAKELAQLMNEVGIETRYAECVQKEAWRKSILNSVLMPVSVTTRLTMARIMETPSLSAIVESLMKDFVEVARCEGYDYGPDFEKNAIEYLATAGDHKPSMLMDFEGGRPLEIDYLNNKIQEYADKHGVTCAYNKLLCSVIHGLLIDRDVVNGKQANA
ncbi:MAG: ketopantoate reductase family protein [Bacteroidota bacterium]